jgi:hypothetical protein
MSFVRAYNNGESYAVVGLAIGQDQDVSVGGIRNGRYADTVNGNVVEVVGASISFRARASSAENYVQNSPGEVGDPSPYLG